MRLGAAIVAPFLFFIALSLYHFKAVALPGHSVKHTKKLSSIYALLLLIFSSKRFIIYTSKERDRKGEKNMRWTFVAEPKKNNI